MKKHFILDWVLCFKGELEQYHKFLEFIMESQCNDRLFSLKGPRKTWQPVNASNSCMVYPSITDDFTCLLRLMGRLVILLRKTISRY